MPSPFYSNRGGALDRNDDAQNTHTTTNKHNTSLYRYFCLIQLCFMSRHLHQVYVSIRRPLWGQKFMYHYTMYQSKRGTKRNDSHSLNSFIVFPTPPMCQTLPLLWRRVEDRAHKTFVYNSSRGPTGIYDIGSIIDK